MNVGRFGSWQSNGGDGAIGRLIGDQLVIRVSEPHHAEIARTLAVLAATPRRIGESVRAEPASEMLIRYDLLPLVEAGHGTREHANLVDRLWSELQEDNRPDTWVSYGGDKAMLFNFRNDFVIFAAPDHQEEIAAFIDAKAATIKSSD